jgi:hypothetical protein
MSDDLVGAAYTRIFTRCSEAFLDGYDLGRSIGGVPKGAIGRALKSSAAASAWIGRALPANRAIGDGPLGIVAAQLVLDWRDDPPLRDVGPGIDRALQAAFAVGLVAVAYEHDVRHAWLEPLVAVTASKRARREIVAHVPLEAALLDAVLADPRRTRRASSSRTGCPSATIPVASSFRSSARWAGRSPARRFTRAGPCSARSRSTT